MDETYHNAYTFMHGERGQIAARANGKTMYVIRYIQFCLYYIRKKNHVRRWNRYI